MKCIISTNFKGLKLFKRGKVRDVYDLGDKLLIVSTDRISCFDLVLPTAIPYKGMVLNQISKFWFDFSKGIIANHLLTTEVTEYPQRLREHSGILDKRSMLVKKTLPLAIECIVRGYLSGSAWKEYRLKGSLCGLKLPAGLRESQELPEAIFTPSTKAEEGHDVNISAREAIKITGKELYEKVRIKALAIYQKAQEHALSRGIIIADTKLEFGLIGNELILIDEVLTPDSSRFWPKDSYVIGKGQASFDKQFVRDYLEGTGWTKEPPAPALPEKIVKKTSEKYLEAYQRLSGQKL
ncbi:MAG: phosphoribosylaminoimidazolesuccinocarboxamide synthase [Omnitrophica WOR_2 bacterium RIFCSPLOWO2_12_FULL_46_30]|nr:MAG: phosphoribosylaminoimidazolesuccinocarboxamide synthase [Omnitrophica WOR_2 bacterium RIFCSPHIGHO2_02_FULL_46_37]OGX43075.1 MAG: phosphoribosylaminoimidazolesuccinocarboxamide synthase [Omnitrophica WOR_2 bacterium RIFCSPLOWO2_02_FULL_45_28]OGX50360.1 MAG: phosphoribosylaminoimidazolesuccinocarboxamide synthase [Omnitrophica WOR_2 bacterium RIFCSPLOWO2_12_FULL_46_30]